MGTVEMALCATSQRAMHQARQSKRVWSDRRPAHQSTRMLTHGGHIPALPLALPQVVLDTLTMTIGGHIQYCGLMTLCTPLWAGISLKLAGRMLAKCAAACWWYLLLLTLLALFYRSRAGPPHSVVLILPPNGVQSCAILPQGGPEHSCFPRPAARHEAHLYRQRRVQVCTQGGRAGQRHDLSRMRRGRRAGLAPLSDPPAQLLVAVACAHAGCMPPRTGWAAASRSCCCCMVSPRTGPPGGTSSRCLPPCLPASLPAVASLLPLLLPACLPACQPISEGHSVESWQRLMTARAIPAFSCCCPAGVCGAVRAGSHGHARLWCLRCT
jgi:hypothetical protein